MRISDSEKEKIIREGNEEIEHSSLMDDMFFRICMEDRPDIVRFMLRIILDDPDLEIEDFRIQRPLDNISGKSVVIDVFAKNMKTGELINIEVQKSKDKHIPQRARYHSSMLDTHVGLKKGEAFRNLPKSVVIFLCADDILERGKAFYDITRKTEDNTPFNDGSRIIILNCSFKGKHKLSKLIDDFNSTSEEGMNYKELSELVEEKKQRLRSEGPMKTFDRGYEYGVQDGLEKGLEQGLQSSRIDTAKKMLSMGKFSYDDIAESTSLPIEKIKELAG